MKKDIIKLYKTKEFSYRNLSELFDISIQRVHQIVKNYKSFNHRGLSFNKIPLSLKNCEMCHKRSEIIHHKDHNSANNNPNNLMQLCRNCHSLIHTYIVSSS